MSLPQFGSNWLSISTVLLLQCAHCEWIEQSAIGLNKTKLTRECVNLALADADCVRSG